jgi:chromosome transmission fidelity protein 1
MFYLWCMLLYEFLLFIGRAIRHINDYSTIVLLDKRYGRTSVQTKLPEWIRSRLQTHTQFGPAFAALRKVMY